MAGMTNTFRIIRSCIRISRTYVWTGVYSNGVWPSRHSKRVQYPHRHFARHSKCSEAGEIREYSQVLSMYLHGRKSSPCLPNARNISTLPGRVPEKNAVKMFIQHARANSGMRNQPEKDTFYQRWFSPKNAWKSGMLMFGSMFAAFFGWTFYEWGQPLKDEEGNEIVDEFTLLPWYEAYWRRFWKEAHFMKKTFEEPSALKLLPDPLKEPYVQPPYTLVLEMTDVLVHPDHTMRTGWRFKKRPGVDYFLQQVGPPLFEVVIYTKEQGFTAFPIINGLDPNGFISFRLFRDATLYRNRTHVKDLGCLNRDLSRVIIVDCDPLAFQLHPRNAVRLDPWKGEDSDRTLVDLSNFLRTIGTSGVPDVRVVLDHYNASDSPLQTFKENQLKLQAQQEETNRLRAGEQQKSLAGVWSPWGLSGRRR